MKERAIALILEAVSVNLISFFFIWKLDIVPAMEMGAGAQLSESLGSSMLLIAAVFMASMVLVGIQGYFHIIKPYSLKMKQMEKAAEENKKAAAIRKEFVANVSHELKTPLTSISGFIETLQEGAAENPEIRTRFIDIIAIETSRLKRLIEDLLVLSDIENKRESAEYAFSAAEAIRNTVEALKPIAEDKDITILTELEEDIEITGSIDRFRQMMVNLIENAIKYSDEGGRIWVKAYSDGKRNVVCVRDEGIGIAPEHHERLFERFYRVDKSRSKKAGGTGLGLSIVKHIAVLFGAELKVESNIGEGSTFFVSFKKEDEDNS